MLENEEFIELIEESKPIILSAIYKFLPEYFYHAIDDVAQEVFIRIFRFISKQDFPSDTAKRNWFYTIAKNESLRMKRKLIKIQIHSDLWDEDSLANIQDINAGYDDEISSLLKAIENLSDKIRPVFQMIVEGYSLKEISDKLGIRPGTVKSRIFHGKNIIKTYMEKEEFK